MTMQNLNRKRNRILLFALFGVLIVVMVPVILNQYGSKPDVALYGIPATSLATGRYPATAKETLEEYLRLDAEGASLSDGGTAYLELLSPQGVHFSNRIASVGVIKGYRVIGINVTGHMARAEIEYDLIGTLENLNRFSSRRTVAQRSADLEFANGKWRIKTMLWSQMSVDTVLAYLRQSNQGSDTDRYQKLVNEIESAARLEPFRVTQTDLDDVKTVVSRYIEFEVNGRVVNAAQDWKSYVTKSFHRRPPSEGAHVVSGTYRIDEIDVYRDEASATVLYNVTKLYFDSKFKEANFQRGSGHTLYLGRTADGWKIDRSSQELPFVYEHVVASNVTITSK